MEIAITGATGFIGKHLLARHLVQGDQVRYLTRKKPASENGAKAYLGDLNSPDELRAFIRNVDIVYHCAAEIRDEALMAVTNVQGTANLLAAADGRIGRWVQLSSTGVYGPQRAGIITEGHPFAPVNAYEKTKLQSDLLVLDAVENRGLDAVILRPSNVYGNDMSNQSLFQLIAMINKGLFFYLGKPGATANYVHVENVVDALVLAGQTANIKSGQAYIVSDFCTLEDFAGFIAENLGKNAPSIRLPETTVRLLAKILSSITPFPLTPSRIDALTGRAVYSTELIEKELSYRNKISMAEGIADLARCYQQFN
jgi:nucleoside-diphosphate-sugar epimerase